MKVVINRCFGGFSISLDAAKYMAKKGHKQAKAEVDRWERENRHIKYFLKHGKWPKDIKKGLGKFLEIDAKYGGERRFHGGGYDRSDKLLVEAVEALGEKANGEHAALSVVEIPDGVAWEIDEYDGREHIAEKHRTWS